MRQHGSPTGERHRTRVSQFLYGESDLSDREGDEALRTDSVVVSHIQDDAVAIIGCPIRIRVVESTELCNRATTTFFATWGVRTLVARRYILRAIVYKPTAGTERVEDYGPSPQF